MAFSPIASPILPQAGPSRHRSERIAMRTIWPAAWNDEEIWMSWTDERIEQLRNMWEKGLTASQIADELGGVNRNAVIGTAHRIGLTSRPSPVKATAKVATPVKAPPQQRKTS